MRTLLFLSLLLISLTFSNNASEGMMNYDPDKTVLLESSQEPVISFKIWFKSGSQDDPSGKEGLAYFTARMLSEGGTLNNSYEQILLKLFPFAASYYASAGTEMTIFGGRIHKDNLGEFYKLFIDQLLNPAFSQDAFARIKENTLNYLKTTLKYSSDEELGKAVLYNKIFRGTGYGHISSGTISSVESITIEDVKQFFKKYYNRNNFVLGLAGGFEKDFPAKVFSDLQKLSDGKENIVKAPEPKPVKGLNVTIVNKKSNATAISIGFPIDLLRGSREWYALAIANSYFGEHRNSSSHLYQVIREARGLNYGDYSYIEHFPNGGRFQMPMPNAPRKKQIFEIWIRPVPNETKHFSLRAALRELRKIVDGGLSQEQFDLTRNFLKKYVLHYAPDMNTRLGYALDDKFYGMKESHLALFRKMMDQLTLEDVNKAIKKYLQYDNMEIVMITDEDKPLKDALVTNAPSPISYATPKPDTVLEEDKEIINYKLQISGDKVEFLTLDELFK